MLVNTTIIANPWNWAKVFLMAATGLLAVHFISATFFTTSPIPPSVN